jgi:ubiquinone/menaquinone biosynthesis C-methylase UbiE
MDRILEPELMEDMEQALAYAHADFAASHQLRVTWFHERYGVDVNPASILDLCCGAGDMTFRFARAFPNSRILGVDGSQAMIDIAKQDIQAEPQLISQIEFKQAYLPDDLLPQKTYEMVISHSALHHFHNPQVLWNAIREYSSTGSIVFLSDLRRVNSVDEANQIVQERAANEHPLLQHDFSASLCAAFTPQELQAQLKEAGLSQLTVEEIGDLYLLVHGRI